MPIFFTTSTDGSNTEGIGSVCQHCVLLYGISRKFEVDCCFKKFTNIAHWQHSGMTNEDFSLKYTNFFNFPTMPLFYEKINLKFDESLDEFIKEKINSNDNYVIEFNRKDIMSYGFNLIDFFFEQKFFLELKNNFNYEGEHLLQDNFLNIAIQIRRKNPTDLLNIEKWANSKGAWEQDNWREMYQTKKESHLFTNPESNFFRYENLFKYLNQKHENIPICYHIFSEGDEKDFELFNNLIKSNQKLVLHLNYHPVHDFYHSINSDFLVMANSSFSWLSGLFNFKIKMISKHFGQPNYPNTIYLEKDYTVSNVPAQA